MDISDRAYIAILAAFAAAVAIAGIFLRDASHDELLSIYFSRPDIALTTVVETWKLSTHVPTYYAVLRGWNEVFGDSLLSTRFMSLLELPLLACLIYPYRTFMGERPFRIFAALTLLCPEVVFCASEARMYIFLIAGTAAVFLFGFRILDAPASETRASLFPFALSALVLSLVDYFGLIFAVATVVVLIAGLYAARRTLSIPLLMLLVAIIVIPAAWTHFAWSELGPQTGGRGWLHFHPIEALRQLVHLLFPKNLPLLLAAAAGLVFSFRRIAHPSLVGFAAAVWLVGYSIAFLVSLNTPVLLGRTLLVITIPTFVVVGAGVDAAASAAIVAWPRWKAWAMPAVAMLVAVSFGGALLRVYLSEEDFRDPSRFMAKAGCANAEILTDLKDADEPGMPGAFVLRYYFRNELHVPSPRFQPYTSAAKQAGRALSNCPVKAFVWRDHVDPPTIWRAAQTELGASANYREIRFANTYLLVDPAAK